jgi:hypothetical protein
MQKTMEAFKDYLEEGKVIHPEDIREVNPQSFTRRRKTTPYKLMLQMFTQ